MYKAHKRKKERYIACLGVTNHAYHEVARVSFSWTGYLSYKMVLHDRLQALHKHADTHKLHTAMLLLPTCPPDVHTS